MTESSPSTFLKKLEEKKAALAAAREAETKGVDTYEDLVPVVEGSYAPTETDIQIAELLNGLSVLDAYNKWCRKSVPNPGNRTEGIKVSCPNPAHPDRDPSAWINTKKNTWYCGGCDIGGDAYDIAAYHFNYPVPGYKDGKTFGQLRLDMAGDLGFRIVAAPGIKVGYIETPTQNAQPASSEDPAESQEDLPGATGGAPQASIEQVDNVTYLDDEDEPIPLSSLDWKPLIEPGTFLDKWMTATEIDDIPEEYYLWNGLLAVGLALGRVTSLFDRRPVYSNLYVCIVGPTGSGKSQSEGHLVSLLNQALPFDEEDPFNSGVNLISSPGSGEAMIWSFQKDLIDPSTGKTMGQMPVRGLLRFNELSALVGRQGRAGSVMKPTLMELYDCSEVVGTRSRAHGKTIAKQPFASLLTTTQPKSMGDLLTGSDVEAGFVNRFVFVSGKEKKRMPIGGAEISVRDSIKPIQQIRAWSGANPQVSWSDKANLMFSDYYHDTLEPAKRKSPTLSRLDLLAKKLILLFTANEMQPEVPVSAVERTIAMMPYLMACYGFTADQIGNDLNWEIREEILRHVKRSAAKGGVTMRDLNRAFARKKWPDGIVVRILKDLAHLQIIAAEATPKGSRGRPAIRYNLVAD